MTSHTDAVSVAERILASLGPAVVVETHEVFVTASIGIAFPTGRECCAETLVDNANEATRRAKRDGRLRWRIFDDNVHVEAKDALALEAELRLAFSAGELEPSFQPIAGWSATKRSFAAMDAHAQSIALPTARLLRKPAELRHEDAAGLPQESTPRLGQPPHTFPEE